MREGRTGKPTGIERVVENTGGRRRTGGRRGEEGIETRGKDVRLSKGKTNLQGHAGGKRDRQKDRERRGMVVMVKGHLEAFCGSSKKA